MIPRRSFIQRLGAGLAALGFSRCEPELALAEPVASVVPTPSLGLKTRDEIASEPGESFEEFRDRLWQETYGHPFGFALDIREDVLAMRITER